MELILNLLLEELLRHLIVHTAWKLVLIALLNSLTI